jgi:glycosyltransferase involved in cell wall biosynthesis
MKILQVAPHFFPYVGGQESYIYNLSKNLVKDGHDVHIITSNYPKSTSSEEIDGITIERNNLLLRPLRNPISSGFFNIKKLSNDFDLIQVHNVYAFPSLVTAYYKNKINCPLIFTDHGKLVFGVKHKDFFVQMYTKHIAKKVLEKTDLVAVLSKHQKEYLSAISPDISDKIKIIPNAIDLELFRELDKNTDKNCDNDDTFTFLYVGQLIKRKGIDWLFKALKIVEKGNKNIKLIIVGDGEHRDYYKKLVNDLNLNQYVEFKGRISNKKKLAFIYKNSDAFVLPSLSEGLPTVILEAIYFGLPVISTDNGGIKEHFDDCVIVVPPRDSVKLAQAMTNLSKTDNLEDAKKLSKNFKNVIESKYTWNAVVDEYEKFYQILLNNQNIKIT